MRLPERLIELLPTINLDICCPAQYRPVAADLLYGAVKALKGEAESPGLISYCLQQDIHLFKTPHVRELVEETIDQIMIGLKQDV